MTATLFGHEQEVATSDDYYTPSWLFEDMGIEFDLDVAAPPGGVPWIPADRFLTMADDGLTTPWEGRVWMNPPFSDAERWCRKFVIHGNGIGLLPLNNGLWLDDLWRTTGSCVLIRDNLLFGRPDKSNRSIFVRTALWAFGDECVEAISRIGHVR
jgi:hypothetical protein